MPFRNNSWTPEDLVLWQEQMNFTTAEAAREFGLPLRTYQNYLAGDRPIPFWLRQFATVLHRAKKMED